MLISNKIHYFRNFTYNKYTLLLLKANESYLKFYASNNDSNPPNKENIPPKFPRLK